MKFGPGKLNLKSNPKGLVGGKQVAHEMLPSRFALSKITGGDLGARSLNNYAKLTPLDANGAGSVGLNLFTKGS